MAREDDGEGSGFGKYIILGVVLLAGVGAYYAFSGKKEPVRQKAPPIVQLKILPPPPPPPPPPKVPPPEPQKTVEAPKISEPMKAVTPSAAPKAPGPPASGPLGGDKGSGPADGFGLGGGGGGGGGGGTVEGYYASQVQGALASCVAEDGRLSHALGRVRFVVSVDATGTPTEIVFQSRFSDQRDTAALQDIVLHKCHMDAPPNDSLRQIHVQLGAAAPH